MPNVAILVNCITKFVNSDPKHYQNVLYMELVPVKKPMQNIRKDDFKSYFENLCESDSIAQKLPDKVNYLSPYIR